MCTDIKITKQVNKDKRVAKYELGTFCEQYGLTPVAPSSKKKRIENYLSTSYYRHNLKNKNKNFDTSKFYENSKPRKDWSKILVLKIHPKNHSKNTCYKCGRYCHYAYK